MHNETPPPPWWSRLLSRPSWLILLATILLLAAVLGPLAWRSYRTKQLATRIEDAGGYVVFQQGGTEWLRDTFGEQWFRMFDTPFAVSIPTIDPLSGMPQRLSKFTDDQFLSYVVPLNELQALESVAIFDSEMTQRSYRQLARFEKLRGLTVNDRAFDDDALALFSNSVQLRSLDLSGTSVSDEGLRHLQELKNLESLSLSNTDVTDEGVSELLRHLPGLDISDD